MSRGKRDDALVYCGACGTKIATSVRFCTSCGESQARFVEAMDRASFCTGCGLSVDADARFCERCGMPRKSPDS
jgi:predicted amidophosphoribosyltransferase